MASAQDFANLTVSTRGVVDIAAYWASLSDRKQITPLDLLIGVSQSHGADSPLQVLLQHYGIDLSTFYDRLNFDPTRLPFTLPSVNLEDVMGQESYYIFVMAQKLSLQYNKRDVPPLIRLDDLFGGLLAEDSPVTNLLREILSPAKVKIENLYAHYREFLKLGGQTTWRKFLRDKLPYLPPDTIRRAVTGFGADAQGGRDLIGIGAEVDAFAYLIAARALQPPLAVGLFGDWGAGKTYFMRSLKERIHQITAEARSSKKPQKAIAVYKHVVQIEFNAWHYVEGELWPSLVEHIFTNLQTQPGDRPSLLAQRQQYWAEQLNENRRKTREVQQQLEQIKGDIAEKRRLIGEIEQRQKEKIQELESLRAADLFDAVEVTDKQKKEWNALLDRNGVNEALDSARQFSTAFDDFRAVYREGHELSLLLRKRGAGFSLRMALALFSGPLVSGLISLLSQDRFPEVANALMGISAVLSIGATLLHQGTNEMRKVIRQVQKAQQTLDARKTEVENENRQKIKDLENELAPLNNQHLKLVDEQNQLNADYQLMEKEAGSVTPRQVMLDFISERVGSMDYSKWLGVPALIRRDFEQLTDLIEQTNRDFIAKDNGEISPAGSHNINRIVLYIDDLDRCPPDKVVKVLQAVHLLLAFPLFVVVVAVDARWLSQSLQEYYKDLLAHTSEENDTDEGEFAMRATPQDYLEKIFQVPFWVPSLGNDARFNIVKGLVQAGLKRLTEIEQEVAPTSDGKSGLVAETRKMENYLAQAAGEDKKGAVKRPVYNQSNPISDTPPGLEIIEPELRFMGELKPLLGATPRSVKRFVNVYWLMKSIALAQPRQQDFLNEGVFAEYKQVLFLLAVLTGLPAIEHAFFAKLCPDPVSGQPAPCKYETLSALVGALISEQAGPGTEPTAAWRDLNRLDKWVCEFDNGSWANLSVPMLSGWASEVARFSYRLERI